MQVFVCFFFRNSESLFSSHVHCESSELTISYTLFPIFYAVLRIPWDSNIY